MKRKAFTKSGFTAKIAAAVLSVTLAFGMTPAIAFAQPDEAPADSEITTLDAVVLGDGTYALDLISSQTMIKPVTTGEHAPRLMVDGETAYLIFSEESKDALGYPKYDGAWLGKRAEAPKPNDEQVVDGVPYGEGDVVDGFTHVLPTSKAALEAALNDEKDEDLYICVRYSDRYTNSSGSSDSAGKWMGSKDNYFTLKNLVPLTVKIPTESIKNNTNMFKVQAAQIEAQGDQSFLRFTLSGTTYQELVLGTFEEAAAKSDGTVANGDGSWVHGTTELTLADNDGKMEFVIPIELGKSRIDLVAVSSTYYNKYLDGTNDLARAMYPRYMELDTDALTLTTGDFVGETALTATTEGDAPQIDAVASVQTVGGPNSNGYKENLTVSTDAQAAYLGASKEAAVATEGVVEAEDGAITITITPNNFAAGGKFSGVAYVAFKLADGSWVDTIVTLDKAAGTVEIGGAVSATVDYTAQAEGAFLVAPAFGATVSSSLAESYGYADAISMAESVSAADVLVAASIAKFGADGITTEKLNWSSQGWINAIFGVKTGNCGFALNGGAPNDGTVGEYGYNGTSVNSTKVADGDLVEFFLYQDGYSLDNYAFLEASDSVVAVGQPFDVTVTGACFGWNGLSFADGEAFKASAEPLEGVSVAVIDPKTGKATDLEVATDEDGIASITLDAFGDCYLAAYGTDDDDIPVIMTLTKVAVAGSKTLTVTNKYARFKASESVLTLTDEGFELAMGMNKSTSYDKLYVGTAVQAAAATTGIVALEKSGDETSFTFPVNKVDGAQFAIAVHSESNGNWYDRVLSVDAAAGTLTTYNGVSATVDYTAQAEGAFLVAPAFDATVASNLAESYGYVDTIPMAESVSALDVLVAAHEAMFEDGFTPETCGELLVVGPKGWINAIFGVPTGNCGFALNGGTPNDGTMADYGYNGTTVNSTKVADGDKVEFFLYQTDWAMDNYAYVEPSVCVAAAGQPFDVIVTGACIGWNGSSYIDGEAFKASAAPLEGVSVAVIDPETGATTDLEVVTDEDGVVSITLPAAGDYYLAAYGTDDYDTPVIMTLTKITVGETGFAETSKYAASGVELVKFLGEVPEGQIPTLNGEKMLLMGGSYVAAVPADKAQSISTADFALVEGAAEVVNRDGDLNGNKDVNIVDAQIAYDIAIGLYADTITTVGQKALIGADINSSNFVDASDAFAIQRLAILGSLS